MGLKPITTAIIGAADASVLASVKQAQESEIISPILVGDSSKIRSCAVEIGWDLHQVDIVNAQGELSIAEEGVKLVSAGTVKMIMKGHIHTDVFVRPLVNKSSGFREKKRLSHVFHMTLPNTDKFILLTDCALNVAPSVKTRISVVQNAVELAQNLGVKRPKVALLAASETVSESMPITQDCFNITQHFEDNKIDADIFGPLALDNILSIDAARIKGIDNVVAGKADIIIVPNIEVGNALFKMMVYLSSACAAGVMLGGSIPVVLTSRSDSPAARMASLALGASLRRYHK